MQIGGLIKLSLVDYPGKIAAVIFTQGCNFRCPWCHNKELAIPACFREPIPQEEVVSFLVKRQGMLQGVVVTGGEPTIQKDLQQFLRIVKGLGYAIKLDTNGSRPDVLKEVIFHRLVDDVAMDIKAPWERYKDLCGVEINTHLLEESVEILKHSRIPCEFRTTVVKPLFHEGDLAKIHQLVDGAKRYRLQNFIPRDSLVDGSLQDTETYTDEEFGRLQKRWEAGVSTF